jgi:ABC-type glycerol-3-phosphate transport system substrate-binding protein
LNNYISKDLLEDLTPYIEEDENVNEDYFIDGYLDATRIDDKLYFLARNFTIKTLVGKKSLFEKYKDGWTIQDIIEYYKKMPGGTKLVYSDDKESLFFYLLYENLDSFIDWDTGEVHFDSEEFRNALQFCNEFETLRENTDYDMSNANEDFKVNRVLLHKEEVNGSAEIQVLKKMFSNDYMFVGFPRKEGRGIYVNIDHAFGICTESEDKDGAWDVLKTLIANHKKSLMQVIMMRSIPSSKEEFEEMVRRDTATENYIDVYGNDVHPRDASYGYDDYELRITPSTKDEIDKLKELIKMADGINGLTDTSSKMVLEDVRPYFDGKRTLDDAIRIIQDRMSKFVNESR